MTRKKEHIGSHSRHSHSIFKLVPLMRNSDWPDRPYTSGQRQVEKKMHTRKIRRSKIDMDE